MSSETAGARREPHVGRDANGSVSDGSSGLNGPVQSQVEAVSIVAPSEPAAEGVALREAEFRRALKRLARLEKQNAFLIDELVKSRQCVTQLKLERNVLLDRFSDELYQRGMQAEDEDASSDEEDESDLDDDQNVGRKRELVDALVESAVEEEAFARVLHELAGHQPEPSVGPVRGKRASGGTAAALGITANIAGASGGGGGGFAVPAPVKKRARPLATGSRFNRLSAATQAMRVGIVSDDEGMAGAPRPVPDEAPLSDLDEFDIGDDDDSGLTQLKRARRANTPAFADVANDSPSTPSKDEPVLKVIPVPLDHEGRPQLPLSLNMITIHSLGQVVSDRPAYHNKRYILPVGFTASRSYLSCFSPDDSITYHCTILDNGPTPLYQVAPEGHPETVFQSPSSTGAWVAVARAAATVRGKDAAASVSGPDYFGLSNPTVSMLIEQLPGAERCEAYVPKRYEVSNLVGGKQAKRTLEEASREAGDPARTIKSFDMYDDVSGRIEHPRDALRESETGMVDAEMKTAISEGVNVDAEMKTAISEGVNVDAEMKTAISEGVNVDAGTATETDLELETETEMTTMTTMPTMTTIHKPIAHDAVSGHESEDGHSMIQYS